MEYDEWLDDVICVDTVPKNQSSDAELINIELDKYNSRAQYKGDPLERWKTREGSMSLLANLAKSVLCLPASSVPSARVFSKAGYLINKRRSALKKGHVNMLIFFNKNDSFKQK